jgi:tRNA(adenine34) deaminase
MDHEYYMRQALLEAEKAGKKNEVPAGAVIVMGGKIIARAHNNIINKSDPCGHAEVIAIRKAAKKTGNERLNGAILYATIEPCCMCAGAILLARIKTLVYGARELKTGACGSVHKVINDPRNNHSVGVVPGVLGDACGAVIKAFFKEKRKGKKENYR